MNYPGDTADPVDVAQWMAQVAKEEYSLPGILPVMTSCVELTQAWTSPGDIRSVPGYLFSQDYDSLGYFQQRPSQGWGTPEECIDPEHSLRAFCKQAKAIEDDSPADTASQLGAWCQAVQISAVPEAYADKGYPMAIELLKNQENSSLVTGQDIVNAAYEVLGAPYRTWSAGSSIPMWLYDGMGDPPPASHIKNYGVMCSDLVSYALERCGLPPCYGTENLAYYLENQMDFDPSTPGVAGAVCLRPYSGPALEDQGHVAIYTGDGEHNLIQSLYLPGVTDAYTDFETYGWGGSTEFTIYGFLPGVNYDGEPAKDTSSSSAGGTWQEYGWYEFESPTSYKLIHHPGEGQ